MRLIVHPREAHPKDELDRSPRLDGVVHPREAHPKDELDWTVRPA